MKIAEKEAIKDQIEALPPAERLEIIGDFCTRCGYKKDRGFCCFYEGEEE